MEFYDIIVNAFVVVGMVAVFLCFGVLMPAVGQVLATLFALVVGEQVVTRSKGLPSGTEMGD